MSDHRENYSILSFGLDSKLHEDLKIRLYYDQLKNQSQFFRVCVEAYLAQDPLFMQFFDEAKVTKEIQSKRRSSRSRSLRSQGQQALDNLALSEREIENIFKNQKLEKWGKGLQ